MKSEVFNIDCMEGMKEFPDNYFDLAVVDPDYGIERFKKSFGTTRFKIAKNNGKNIILGGKPEPFYFIELFRVSKYQIIWGANNFTLPQSEYFIIWDKYQTVENFASAEYAWTNIKMPAKVFRYSIHRHNITNKIHPTQKPVALYEWIFKNYTEEGQKILDTHLGSGSSRIAAYNYKMDFTGYEIDKDYFDAAEKRYQNHIAQLKIFP